MGIRIRTCLSNSECRGLAWLSLLLFWYSTFWNLSNAGRDNLLVGVLLASNLQYPEARVSWFVQRTLFLFSIWCGFRSLVFAERPRGKIVWLAGAHALLGVLAVLFEVFFLPKLL